MRRLVTTTALILCSGLSPQLAWAEPITITAGTVYINPPFNDYLAFRFESPEFVQGEAYGDEGLAVNTPTRPAAFVNGEAADLSSLATFPAAFGSSTALDGFHRFAGEFVFTAAPSVLTNCEVRSGGSTSCTSFSTFHFTGLLTGRTVDDAQLFRHEFVGTGTVSGVYDSSTSRGIVGLRYDFAASDPVPEPASLFLLGSGLAGFAILRRRIKSPEDC